MVLRIEDTDVERSEQRYEDQLLDDLKWLGLDWDEGPDVGGGYAPYRQSDRLAIYREHAERLLSDGKAYLCFCSQEELERERERALKHISGRRSTPESAVRSIRRRRNAAAPVAKLPRSGCAFRSTPSASTTSCTGRSSFPTKWSAIPSSCAPPASRFTTTS